jgi:hypothetical protein
MSMDSDRSAKAQALADQALSLRLNTTTRAQIDRTTAVLTAELRRAARVLLLGDTLRVRARRSEVAHLLGLAPRPEALTFSTHTYMQDVARLLRAVIIEHGQPDDEPIQAPVPLRKVRPAHPWAPQLDDSTAHAQRRAG